MPRIKLNLPKETPWTKVPNYLIDQIMPTLRDTELRLVLIVLRQTVGWNLPNRPVILSYRTLMKRSGRASEAVANAIRSLHEQGIIHSSRTKLPRRHRSSEDALLRKPNGNKKQRQRE